MVAEGRDKEPADDELEVKKAEQLYELARESYASEDRRFDSAEAKISRYLSILFVVLGLSTFGAQQVRITLREELDLARWLLVGSMAGFYVSGMVSFFLLVRAIRLQDIRALRLDRDVVTYFAEFEYVEALVNLALAFLHAASGIRVHVEDKLALAYNGFNALIATVVFAVAGSASYLFLEITEPPKEPPAMSQPSGTQQAQESTSTSTGSAPASPPANQQQGSSSNAEQAAEALFETIQKGFEGGVERKNGREK